MLVVFLNLIKFLPFFLIVHQLQELLRNLESRDKIHRVGITVLFYHMNTQLPVLYILLQDCS